MNHTTKYPLIKAEFAARLRKLRKEKGLIQEQVAEKIGIPLRRYNGWENPKTDNDIPKDLHDAVCLCEVLDTDLIYLLTGLYDGQKEQKHEEDYLNIYSRYKKNGDFYLLLELMMEWDDATISTMTSFFERLDDQYKGGPLIKS